MRTVYPSGEPIMPVQRLTFTNGGFQIHKLTIPGYVGYFSAGFDIDENLQAACHCSPERVYALVPERTPMWRAIQRAGRAYSSAVS